MAEPRNIDRLISQYWEGDRTGARQRYEELFGDRDGDPSDFAPLDGCDFRELDDETAFQRIVELLDLSEAIRSALTDEWETISDRDRRVALHYLGCCGISGSTVRHKLEGMEWYFGAWVTTHLLHRLIPNSVFPIDTHQGYVQFRSYLGLLGIEYDDNEQLFPVEIATNISSAVAAFRMRHGLAFWQMWALVYDFAPRMMPPPGPYPTDPPPRMWVTGASDFDFDQVDAHTSNDCDTWPINRRARRGDLVLMYCLRPRSALAGVYRCNCDAYRDPFCDWCGGVWTEITDKVTIPPLTLREMTADPVLRDWSLVRTRFQGMKNHEVPTTVWARIKELVSEKDPQVKAILDQIEVAPRGTIDVKYPDEVRTEGQVGEDLVIPLLERLGWTVGRTLHRQYELAIKAGSGQPDRVKADFVGFRDPLGSDPLMVIETKRRIRTDAELQAAVEQCESYAAKFRCRRFAIAAPEGLWVYELKSPDQSVQCGHVALESQVSPATVAELEPLIGFDALQRSK